MARVTNNFQVPGPTNEAEIICFDGLVRHNFVLMVSVLGTPSDKKNTFSQYLITTEHPPRSFSTDFLLVLLPERNWRCQLLQYQGIFLYTATTVEYDGKTLNNTSF